MNLFNSIFADSSAGYFGNTLAFGDPRDAFIKSANRNGGAFNNQWSVQGTTLRSSYRDPNGIFGNIDVGSNRNDYITAYNDITSGIDFLLGGTGADTFVAGDQLGPHYYTNKFGLTNPRLAIALDYHVNEGDTVQLSASGLNGYTSTLADFNHNVIPDSILYYQGKPIMVLLDAPSFKFTVV